MGREEGINPGKYIYIERDETLIKLKKCLKKPLYNSSILWKFFLKKDDKIFMKKVTKIHEVRMEY